MALKNFTEDENKKTIVVLSCSAEFTRRGTWRANFSLRQKRTAKYDGE